jgi:hypothetical protein
MKNLGRMICLMVLLLAFITISSCSTQCASSQSSTVVKVEASTTSATIGKTFTVTITVTDVQNLYGLEVILNWNATVLQIINVDTRLGVESFPDGVLHESSNSPAIFIAENNLTQTEGEYRLDATSMVPAASFTGSGNIAKITFRPISIGNSELNLRSQLYDYPPTDRDKISLPIQHTTQDSFITVTESTNTPSSTPSTSELPPTPTPTTPLTSPTLSPTLEPQKLNVGNELILPIILLILLITVIALIILRKRKTTSQKKQEK